MGTAGRLWGSSSHLPCKCLGFRLQEAVGVGSQAQPALMPGRLCPSLQDCTDPCCDYFTCQLRPGAQCASDGLCCHNCQVGTDWTGHPEPTCQGPGWKRSLQLPGPGWICPTPTLTFTHPPQLRPAGWKCRPTRGDCDLPEFCPGDSSQCPPDVSMGDGEPCAGGQAVCMQGRCASYAQQCQALWGPGAKPAAPLCLLTANTRGDAFGSCGRNPDGS